MDRRDNMIEEEILIITDREKLIKTPNKPKEEDIFYSFSTSPLILNSLSSSVSSK